MSQGLSLGNYVRELLCESVVEVARDPPAFLESRCACDLPLVEADLPGAADEDEQEGAEAKDVPDVDPLRVQGREQEVVQPGEGREDGACCEPAQQLVALAIGAPRESHGGEAKQQSADELGDDERAGRVHE